MINSQLLSIENYAVWTPQLPISKSSTTQSITIPVTLKRRCSHLIKIALETANKAAGSNQIDYAIFCSQHGELNSTIDLLSDICQRTTLSPTKFSQSVHNTVAGLFCIIHQLHIDTISIAAHCNTFLMGMLEAFTWLKLNPGKTVLLAMFDGHPPEEYKKLKVAATTEYAIAMLLTDKATIKPCFSFVLDPKPQQNSSKNLPLALEFLQWYLEPITKKLTQNTACYIARWHKT